MKHTVENKEDPWCNQSMTSILQVQRGDSPDGNAVAGPAETSETLLRVGKSFLQQALLRHPLWDTAQSPKEP